MADDLIEQLKRQMDTLRERNRQLEELLAPSTTIIPVEWRLTPSEARVFAHLTTRDKCTKDSIMAAMYSDRIDVEPEIKIVDVFICKLRRKLNPYDVTITTIWGSGYSLENREQFSGRKTGLGWNLGLLAERLDAGDIEAAKTITLELRTNLQAIPA